MNVTIVGSGYVGLVSGVCLAAKGHDVTCVDVRKEIVESLNNRKPHIHEKGLPELLSDVVASGRFRATTNLVEAIERSALVMVAVGTPSEAGAINLSYVKTAVNQIGEALRSRDAFLAVVIKSTVVPGSTDSEVLTLLQSASGKHLGDFGLGMNPEFLREGNAIEDFMFPDRIVCGFEDLQTRDLLRELYAPWSCERVEVNTRTAELIKYANNSLLATQISAVNEIANFAAALSGIDVMDVMRGVHLDKRWNPSGADGSRVSPEILSYLVPGCGFGGSCFPKDVQALVTHARSVGVDMPVLQGVMEVNEAQPGQVVRLLESLWGSLKGRRVLILGTAFKPGTDDVRESASLKIIRKLCAAEAMVAVHDPIALANARASLAGLPVDYVEKWEGVLDDVDAVVVATAWPEYAKLADRSLKGKLRRKGIVDARRMFAPSDFPDALYRTIGFTPRHVDGGL